ncbi:MAG: SDR family oxidoreductase [Clostridia bacterium]|nr:SDR family oxidoreductase [Clostridia bacterium]
MTDMFHISGKKAIVTGGSRGLGKCMAEALKDAGVDMVIMGSSDTIYQTAKELNTSHSKVKGIKADLSHRLSIVAAFSEAMDFLGGIDILVNNAGTQIRNKCEEFLLEDWDKVLEVNLTAPFIMSQLAGREMLAQGKGKIINIASMLSFSGGFSVPAYAASKGGIAQITKAMSNEWASRGINVNAIAPGYMDTDNTAAIKEDKIRNERIIARIPAGRWGRPEDMKGALIYLASDASNYVHGSILLVDGGWMGC